LEVPGDFLEHRLEADADFRALPPDDRRLAQELVFGILRRRATLDWLVQRRTDGRRQRPEIRILLHLGLYQLLYLDRIPTHAAVHETVELARAGGLSAQTGFLNAVLRGTVRDLPATRQALADLAATDPATATSHPAWLVDRWRESLTPPDLARLLELNNLPPPTFARINRLRTDAAALARVWEAEGVRATAREFSWSGPEQLFELQEHPSLASLGSFQRGEFYVQDPSTLLAVTLLDPQPGESILDACAAPGGKTTLIASRLQNRGRIQAEDVSLDRLRLVEENVARLGVTCVVVKAVSANPDPAGEAETALFDRILIDAPCSNTGVFRRRVEARWRLQPDVLERLRREQAEILHAVSRRVRPGGVLVYSTCSLEREENAAQVSEFLSRESAFEWESSQGVLPWRDGVDGAFAARLRRK